MVRTSGAAEAHARLAATRLLNWRPVGEVGPGAGPGDASGVKFAGTESAVEVYRMCQETGGGAGLVRAGSLGAFDGGELERMNRAAQDQHLWRRGERGAKARSSPRCGSA